MQPNILPQGGPKTGYGIAQWTPAKKLTDWRDAHGYNWSTLEGQCACLYNEMTNPVNHPQEIRYPYRIGTRLRISTVLNQPVSWGQYSAITLKILMPRQQCREENMGKIGMIPFLEPE